jgi:TonB family protein
MSWGVRRWFGFGPALIGLLACGPGVKEVPPKDVDAELMSASSGNEQAIRDLLRGSVTYAGLWFNDPACTQQFPVAAPIPAEKLDAFAHCLAGLHWHASSRVDPIADVLVLTYPPGIEIEARVVRELDGPRVQWIGFTSRRDESASLPSITPEVLEALRTAGDRDGPLDPEVAGTLELDRDPDTHSAHAWFQVCIDIDGRVTSARVRAYTSPKAAHAFADAIAKWQFQPFIFAGHPLPVCSLLRSVYPVAAREAKETLPLPLPPSRSRELPEDLPPPVVPPKVLEVRRIAGEKLIQPDVTIKNDMQRHRIGRMSATYRFCLNPQGHIESLDLLKSSGYAAYDRELAFKMRSWVYSPFLVDGKPTPVCSAVTFIYNQR